MNTFRKLAVALGGSLVALLTMRADPLPVGTDAPTVPALLDTGESLPLANAYSEGPVLLFFYPKAFTGGCTAQACNLRDAFTELQDEGITIFGVSKDDVETQAAFREEHGLQYNLIADESGTVGGAFGIGTMAVVGMYSRQTVLVVDGKIAWVDERANPSSQAEDALVAYRANQG